MSREEGTHGPNKWQKTPGAGLRKNYKGLERESEVKMIRAVREREAGWTDASGLALESVESEGGK